MTPKIKIDNAAEVCRIDIEGTIGCTEEAQAGPDRERTATYRRFREALEAIAGIEAPEVVVEIRSTGGDVNDALLIHDALRALQGRVTTRCYGYTASAATLIAQAASERRRELSANALYLIHNSVCAAEGTASELEACGELLRRTDERIAALYAARSGRPVDEIAALMGENGGAGRWLSPEEAVAAGLADRIIGAEEAPAKEAATTEEAAAEEHPEEEAPNGAPNGAPKADAATWAGRIAWGWRQIVRAVAGSRAESAGGESAEAEAEVPRTHEKPLPQDRNVWHPAAARRRSLVAMEEAQRCTGPTRTLPREDPPFGDRPASANEQAYDADAQRIRCR